MKQSFPFLLAVIIQLTSCVQKEKVIEKEIIKEVEADVPDSLLMHNVFLNLKDSISGNRYDSIMTELARLKEVESVLWYHYGAKANTGDARLDKDYDIALHVVFESENNLKLYAKDPLHLDVRANIKDYLKAAPVVFDYWTK